MAANFLYVQTHDSKDPRVELPYHELMPFRVYLTTVLAPAFHSTIKDNGCTVADCFRYISDDLCIRVRFDREHRNERLGNFIPPGATLTRFPDRGESDGLYGNAEPADRLRAGAVRASLPHGMRRCHARTQFAQVPGVQGRVRARRPAPALPVQEGQGAVGASRRAGGWFIK